MTNKTDARHAAVKALHDIMQAVPSSSLYSLAEAVLDAGFTKNGDDYVIINAMYFSHAEILEWREDSCTPAPEAEESITIEAVGITREGDDGLYIEWTLEGGIAALETAGLVLFACPEANDMCEEDGSAEIYLQPVDLDATEQRGFIRGMNAESEARDARATSTMACDMPPPGWTCSRAKGHDGPCAASQAPVQPKQENFTYSSTQSTNCAGCGKHKHTPLRVDAMGGYVCLTCIDSELDRLLIEESARQAEPDWDGAQEISDLPHVHDMLQDFSADPTEDNAISVVQAIVMATTRKPAE